MRVKVGVPDEIVLKIKIKEVHLDYSKVREIAKIM